MTGKNINNNSIDQLFLVAGDIDRAKELAASGIKTLEPALIRLRREADEALEKGPFSVTHKTETPPDGDKHNYFCIGPYWWPNPDTADRKPYLQRDGERNPESLSGKYDRTAQLELGDCVSTMALAYRYTGYKPYAAQCAKLLRTWYLDRETRMNPNLQYAQIVPGVKDNGRPQGIIRGVDLAVNVIDWVGLISQSGEWTSMDREQFMNWEEYYLQWLLDSEVGRGEAESRNNHGTWYYVQVASVAAYIGRHELAEKVVKEIVPKLIEKQIEPDGSQPEELRRTLALHYSFFNLRALFNLATIGEYYGVDLWNYRTKGGGGIRKALDWLLAFSDGKAKFPYRQIREFRWVDDAGYHIYMADKKYRDKSYREFLNNFTDYIADNRVNLLYPML